ncbi:hypothetical protein BQ8794_50705 [Mesorhizobium prunaredense]|uniref:Uncharacterized protein n=1 Tax=Mesorhizobium prunaredense TaxID=1631249 RepID=A0A1R3VFF2_9HYPH|nr:WD40 repeat domain-containing protein [Mesorhizobium prunaredense]SIT58603.1 hypothetical protein BQ8794_50705 [Mesorhizobium prunaredense]
MPEIDPPTRQVTPPVESDTEGNPNPYKELTDYELSHLSHHLCALEAWAPLERLLTDLLFLSAKTEAGMVDGLLQDYEITRLALGSRWHEDQPIAVFDRFVSREAHFLRTAPETLYQQAANTSDVAIQEAAALLPLVAIARPSWLRKTRGAPHPQHTAQVISLAFWREDRYLAVSSLGREVWIWDLVRGELSRRCQTPPSAAKSLVVSPDGRFLAAGFGAAEPTPHASGAIVWDQTGRAHRLYGLGDFVYHVRWRSDDHLILGAGLPTGSEAAGTLWLASLSTGACTEIGQQLASRPLVLTWDPVPGRDDHVMMLSMDGVVCYLTPDHVPITQEKTSEIFSEIHLERKHDPDQTHARMVEFDDRIDALRPIVSKICAPCTGTFGFSHAAQAVGRNAICVLGEPPIPPEMTPFHQSVPDGIYLYDFDRGTGGSLGFNPEALDRGFRVNCLAVEPGDSDRVCLGTAHGVAELISIAEDGGSPKQIHKADYAVTAICFSQSGKLVAVGDSSGQISVYDQRSSSLVFESRRREEPSAARIVENDLLLLYQNRLVAVPLNRADDVVESIALPDGEVGVDFDAQGSLAVILSGRVLGETRTLKFFVHIVDLDSRKIILSQNIPGDIPLPPRSLTDADQSDYPNRILLRVSDGAVNLLVGSPRGLIEYPLFAPITANSRSFLLPYDRNSMPKRTITVMRVGMLKAPLESAAIAPGGTALFCGYADTEDHPRVSGKICLWDCETAEHSIEQRFSGSVHALCTTLNGVVIVGTDDNEASAWRFDGGWQRIAGLRHEVAVMAVACAEEQGLVCSVSRDGMLIVWRLLTGEPLLRTFVDVEPKFAGFLADGKAVCVIDRSGEIHMWKIEGYDQLNAGGVTPKSASRKNLYPLAQQCLHVAAHLKRIQTIGEHGDRESALALLKALPDIANRDQIYAHWRAGIFQA